MKIRNPFRLHVSSDRDRQLAKERYDTKAAMEHGGLATEVSSNQQSLIAELLNQPYEVYYRKITENITSNMKVLELGAGTGATLEY